MKVSSMLFQIGLAAAFVFPNVLALTQTLQSSVRLDFLFFDDVKLREATACEIDGLMIRTSEWFFLQLQETFPSLESFQAVFVGQTIDVAAEYPEYPITLNFNAIAEIAQGATHTTADLFTAMESLNFNNYITDAVWTESQTGGLFEDVHGTALIAREATDDGTGNVPMDTNMGCADDEDMDDLQPGNTETENGLAIDSEDCATALQAYRESNGENFYQVKLECLQSSECASAVPASIAKTSGINTAAMHIQDAEIACNFTEHTAHSEWSDCVTRDTEESVDLGNLLNFTASDDDWPMIKRVTGYNYTDNLEWGITKGCGNDNHVYLLYRNGGSGAAEGSYSIIGYQSWASFLEKGNFIHGSGEVDAQGISGIAPGQCAYGNQFATKLIGSCRLIGEGLQDVGSDAHEDDNSENTDEEDNSDSSSVSRGCRISYFVSGCAWTWFTSLVLKAV
ncbi:expressed unknown protein [Seminavis robusta]|uniref:Uncharacterized protein n=1 Tax=Seminavis robusta TaxID=568900 RepID=A0A9N8HB50_9STRA|nr:expressed unknown protein [Seminavis robusta]|eukprot:Sro170_g075370.1 n/a (452) ;mRNA; r:36637-38153